MGGAILLPMEMRRIIEYVFLFGLLGTVGYIVWTMVAPLVTVLALSSVIVTICYPVYVYILNRVWRRNESLAAFLSTLLVLAVIVIPIFYVSSVIVNEVAHIYTIVSARDIPFQDSIDAFEESVQYYLPGVQVDIAALMVQGAHWLAGNLGTIFRMTAATIFLFFISMIGSFYLFRDGRRFVEKLIDLSPLTDMDDEKILRRMATAVRSVATGTILVALIQGALTSLGLWLFGFERVALWGSIAAFGALIPGVGTTIVFIPAIVFLLISSEFALAIGLALWAMTAVGLIDNLLGPYFIGRGSSLHPFVILIAVLGGIYVFGPIGFIIGPVIVSLFLVLLEVYVTLINRNTDTVVSPKVMNK